VGLTTIRGTLAAVRYVSEETGFTVGSLKTATRADLCVVGKLPAVPLGSFVRLEGWFCTHDTYGEQFKIKSFEVEIPSSEAGILGYLGYMPNIGPGRAQQLVRHFGKEVLTVIEETPERLTEVRGITPDRAKVIHATYLEHGTKREILIFLKKLQMTDNQINRVLSRYTPVQIYRVFEKNPYQLIEDVPGFGFKIVDGIAIRSGYDKNGIPRAKAACRHLLRQASEQEGHVYLPWGTLKYRLMHDLEIDPVVAHRAVEFMRQDGYIVIEGESKVFDVIYMQREARCAKRLLEMMKDR